MEKDARIAHVWDDMDHPAEAWALVAAADKRFAYSLGMAEAVSLFEAIDTALAAAVPQSYLALLLETTDDWNGAGLIAEVAASAYSYKMDPEYVQAVYLLEYRFDDWKTLSERLVELYLGGVPAEYAKQTASGSLYVADITAAWQAGIASEYVAPMVGQE
jgi:hypothetical protein